MVRGASKTDDGEGEPAVDDDVTPEEALRNVAAAIKRLETSTKNEHRSTVVANFVVVVVSVFVFAALMLHTFLEKDAPQVDETSVLLLIALLFAPFVGHLRSLEIGGAKAEWRDDASNGFVDVLVVLRQQHSIISKMFEETKKGAADAESEDEAPVGPEAVPGVVVAAERSVRKADRGGRVLRRVLWVDDHPERNAYELEDLRKLFDVSTAKSTKTGIKHLATGGFDAVVSDIVREENRVMNPDAGGTLADYAAALDPPLPVFIYSSEAAVVQHGEDLAARGALIVTASYTELVKGIRQKARETFDSIVLRVLRLVPGALISEQYKDLDYLLTLEDGRRYAVETPHWLRPPKSKALDRRYEMLSHAIRVQGLSGALLVTQRPLLSPEQRRRAPEGIRPIEVDDLVEEVRALNA